MGPKTARTWHKNNTKSQVMDKKAEKNGKKYAPKYNQNWDKGPIIDSKYEE